MTQENPAPTGGGTPMLIFDGDYPMAALAIQLRRDVTQPLDELRRRDRDHENIALASLPEMRKAGMAVAILKVVSDMQREGSTITGYNAPHRLYAVGKGQIAYTPCSSGWASCGSSGPGRTCANTWPSGR